MSYGKVSDTFWTDEKVLRFSDDAKMLALYLITGPHRNLIGCMRVPSGYVVADLGWDLARVDHAFDELGERGFVVRDASGWTHIVNQLRHDPLSSPNHGKAAIKLLQIVPAGPVRTSLVKRLSESLKALGEGFENYADGLAKELASPFEAPSKPLRTPIPEPVPVPVPEPSPPVAPQGAFESFWAVYPKRVGRKAALKAYQTALKETDHETIERGASRYAAWCESERADPKFIAHPATWLNAGRWADELRPSGGKTAYDPRQAERDRRATIADVLAPELGTVGIDTAGGGEPGGCGDGATGGAGTVIALRSQDVRGADGWPAEVRGDVLDQGAGRGIAD